MHCKEENVSLAYFVGTVVGSDTMRADLELCRPVTLREDTLRDAVVVEGGWQGGGG